MPTKIALIGDYDPNIIPHQAVVRSIELGAIEFGEAVVGVWLHTASALDLSEAARSEFNGFWCVPNSPYASMEGALRTIRHAREEQKPFLGTCGGFQHALIEHARNVLGWHQATHAESEPDAPLAVISRLSCPLAETEAPVLIRPDTLLARIYGRERVLERFNCNFGLNPRFRPALTEARLLISAEDERGEARAVERSDHPFFLGTLFQPERAALRGELHPLIRAFIGATLAKA